MTGGDAQAASGLARADAVRRHPRFQRELARVEEAERDREFCRHGMAHLLDVARVAWILNLEEGRGLARDLVYAAALLHDIGRAEQYATGEPHDAAGERIAAEILGTVEAEARFSPDECACILAAVRGHRGHGGSGGSKTAAGTLASLIKRADKLSRPCFACDARAACYWPDEKKNLALKI